MHDRDPFRTPRREPKPGTFHRPAHGFGTKPAPEAAERAITPPTIKSTAQQASVKAPERSSGIILRTLSPRRISSLWRTLIIVMFRDGTGGSYSVRVPLRQGG